MLKTSTSQDETRKLLPSLKIVLAAHATDAIPQGEGSNAASASGKHDLTSKTCAADEDVELVTAGNDTFVVWKCDLHLVRPKARLQRPAIYFTATIMLKKETSGASRKTGSTYLKAYDPLPANVLAPLQFDPALRSSAVQLSETRITKVTPARAEEAIKPIRGASKRAFPAVSALFTRIRYSTLPDAVIASLHIEMSQVIAGTVRISDVRLDSPGLSLEAMNASAWPLEARGGDEIVTLFKIHPPTGKSAVQGTLFINIAARVSLDQGSSVPLEINWQAQVDVPSPKTKPTYRWSRPLSGSSFHHSRPAIQSNSRPTSLDVPHAAPLNEPGILLTITGPPTVRASADFELHVQCINHSPRPRRFAIVVVPTKKSHALPPRPGSRSDGPGATANLIASIFNTPPLEPYRAPDVLDLNPDVRIGPLAPGACYETRLRFRAVALGVLGLGILRLVDLETRQSVDVRELPDVVALEDMVS